MSSFAAAHGYVLERLLDVIEKELDMRSCVGRVTLGGAVGPLPAQ
jgi:hypothetical protein